MAPAGLMNGPLVGRHNLGTSNEILPRLCSPLASQELIRLPQLRAFGASGLHFPRLPATEADHRVRLATLRETSLVAPDSTRPTGLVGHPTIWPCLYPPFSATTPPGRALLAGPSPNGPRPASTGLSSALALGPKILRPRALGRDRRGQLELLPLDRLGGCRCGFEAVRKRDIEGLRY